jgi:hypothetical protein
VHELDENAFGLLSAVMRMARRRRYAFAAIDSDAPLAIRPGPPLADQPRRQLSEWHAAQNRLDVLVSGAYNDRVACREARQGKQRGIMVDV